MAVCCSKKNSPPDEQKNNNITRAAALMLAVISAVLLIFYGEDEWNNNVHCDTTVDRECNNVNIGVIIVFFHVFNIFFMGFNMLTLILEQYENGGRCYKFMEQLLDWAAAISFYGLVLASMFTGVINLLTNTSGNPFSIWLNVYSPLHFIALIPVHMIFMMFIMFSIIILLYICGVRICCVKIDFTSRGIEMSVCSNEDKKKDA